MSSDELPCERPARWHVRDPCPGRVLGGQFPQVADPGALLQVAQLRQLPGDDLTSRVVTVQPDVTTARPLDVNLSVGIIKLVSLVEDGATLSIVQPARSTGRCALRVDCVGLVVERGRVLPTAVLLLPHRIPHTLPLMAVLLKEKPQAPRCQE